jgi:hypothetical protein
MHELYKLVQQLLANTAFNSLLQLIIAVTVASSIEENVWQKWKMKKNQLSVNFVDIISHARSKI